MPDEFLSYRWYAIVEGATLEQGDVLDDYPVFAPPPDLAPDFDVRSAAVDVDYKHLNLMVMTQSCDLELKHTKAPEVLLCPVWQRDQFSGELAKLSTWEEARKGRLPSYHVLHACDLEGFQREARIVDFRSVYTLPTDFVRQRVKSSGPRLRLMPPYREHLAQAFARFFMRVGLPVDIPPFK